MDTDKIFMIKNISDKLSNLILIKENIDKYGVTLCITVKNRIANDLEYVVQNQEDYDSIKNIISDRIEKLKKELEEVIKL